VQILAGAGRPIELWRFGPRLPKLARAMTDDLVAQAWELLIAQRTDEGLALFGEAVARMPHDDRVFHERKR
jgi:hypothetical protein